MQHIFLSKNNILMGIYQMLLLQLDFDIDNVLNEKKLIFLRGMIYSQILFVQPEVFGDSGYFYK